MGAFETAVDAVAFAASAAAAAFSLAAASTVDVRRFRDSTSFVELRVASVRDVTGCALRRRVRSVL